MKNNNNYKFNIRLQDNDSQTYEILTFINKIDNVAIDEAYYVII